jgi:hypothetical protein
MTDSSVCMILVSIHWSLAIDAGASYKARKMTAIAGAKPKNSAKSLSLLVPRGWFYSQVAPGFANSRA